MLYAFFGNDIVKVRAAASHFIKEREGKAAVVRISPQNYTTGSLENAAGGTSLFGEEQLFIIDTPSELAEMSEQFFDVIDTLAESANTFVLIEGKLLAPEKKKLLKHAKDPVEITAPEKTTFNSFALADALLSRDKKKLWVLLMKARSEGLSTEELIGTLFWQLKTIRAAAVARSAGDAGLKPFVYSKAKSARAKFSESDLASMLQSLVTLYHDGHTGKRDIDIALERWVLAL